MRILTTFDVTTRFLYLLLEESYARNPFIRKQYVNGTTCHWKQKNLNVYTFSKKNWNGYTGITKVKSYTRMVMVCLPLIIVGCALGSAISEIIYLTIILYSQNFAKIISETFSHFLLFCPRRHKMLSEISTIIFPGTNYNTVIAIMPDYLCNILLQGSEDENKTVFDCVFKINDSGCFEIWHISTHTHKHTRARTRTHAHKHACTHRTLSPDANM